MKKQHRRDFLRTGGLVAVAAIFPLGCDKNDVRFKSMPLAPGMDVPMGSELNAAPITRNERFYLQSINGPNYDYSLRVEDWRLRIDGLVETPLEALGYEDITSLPIVRQVITLQCIGNWIGGPLVGNAEWGGTPLWRVLEMAGVQAETLRVKFYSVDGYTTSIPLEDALREETLLVWEMNGEVLPSKHGYPLRLINPGNYGQKMPKWIVRIELIDEVYLGYWESKPENKSFKWSDDAIATVNSRIDAPFSVWDDVSDPANGDAQRVLQRITGAVGELFVVHGIAMAGERSIEQVEVSTDGGQTWDVARLTSESVPYVWVTWAYEWPLPSRGNYEIIARATDSAGDMQPVEDAGADLYDGRTGWHRVPVEVATQTS
ncbi:MAG: DMSO/TMAO reductase YedYZ molybdopterin-dependent catalytic subunit [Candidatus Latescibacterota bacterium]|jgi:DMSO/TMAO reductase YedYZ molybdopterin-dependent catalytic subunit